MRTSFYKEIEKDLDYLKAAGTYKKMHFLKSPVSNWTEVEDHGKVLLLCSNNYLGLANNPEIIQAGMEALKKYGAGAASVRFICGTFDIHRTLEEKTAGFLGTEAALTYTSCWDANIAVLSTLLKDGDTIISDELNHASIIDGCRLSGKEVKKLVYKHADLNSLEEKLKESKDSKIILVVTDGIFSMEGDIAPLKDIVELCERYNAMVMVDDSHAIGVIGKTGRGTAEYFDLIGKIDIITGTYGKALGGAGGGFIASKKSVIDLCIQKSRPHLFSNSLSPVLAGIAIAALEYLEDNPSIVQSLHEKIKFFQKSLQQIGLQVINGESAIIPIIIGDTTKAIRIAEKMFETGVYVIGFGYPIVPEGKARIRIQISDILTYDDLDYAVKIIEEIFKKYY